LATWIFQGNPNQFDIDTYLSRARSITWSVKQKHFAERMAPGDRVFLWRAAGQKKDVRGVVASGWLTERPRVQPADPVARDLWHVPSSGRALAVRLEVDRVANAKEVIQADWLADDPILHDLRILLLRNETDFLLSGPHTARLTRLWENIGRDWTRAESLAGLWAYDHTYGQSVSRKPGSPVAVVARRIGRVVSGVYNKGMNFRAIDPRDDRQASVDTQNRPVMDT
jgi:hypothetical protein